MTTPVLVLDTSVMVKWFRQQEVDADKALIIRNAYLAGQVYLLSPEIALVEFANVLRYLGDLRLPETHLAIDSLFDMGIAWLPSSRPLSKRAIEIARSHDTTVYDALFAAIAEDIEAIYITADKRFTDKTSILPFVRLLAEFRLEDVIDV